jgi:hypothetical protein
MFFFPFSRNQLLNHMQWRLDVFINDLLLMIQHGTTNNTYFLMRYITVLITRKPWVKLLVAIKGLYKVPILLYNFGVAYRIFGLNIHSFLHLSGRRVLIRCRL